MNDKIIEMVRRTPGIKTGQIADQLDVDFGEAERLCSALVLANRLTGEMVPLAGGGRVMAYHVLGQLREQPRITPPKAFEQAVPKFLPNGHKNPDAPLPSAAELSKVDRAIEWIRANGPATDDQLRAAMDIGQRPPRTYLASAMNTGRVARDGALWKLGAGKPARKPKPLVHDLGSVVRVGNVIAATRDGSQVDPVLVAHLAGAQPPEPTTSSIHCAIWSDGTYEVKTDGVTVAMLRHEEAQALLAFVEKMGAA